MFMRVNSKCAHHSGMGRAVKAAGRAARRATRAVLLPANFVGWSDQDVLK